MEIRGDFRSVESWLQRLAVYAKTFTQFNVSDWSHLKNQEDFNMVNRLPVDQRTVLEHLYGTGRDIAVYMSNHLTTFNYPDTYPTLKGYVDSFNHGWIYQIDILQEDVAVARAVLKDNSLQIWSAEKMTLLFDRQIELLQSVAQTVGILRGSELYLTESGYIAPNPSTLATEQILTCLNLVGAMFERLPRTYASKDEEGLRDHMLVTLESAVAGSSTGETFNRRGKTDILVRSEGKNTFVAECKFWSGPQGFIETIDQLLSYLTWRDKNAAVIMFVKNVHFGNVVISATSTVPSHKNFIRELPKGDSTWRNYEFRSAADPSQSVTISLMLFHLDQSAI